MRPFFSLTMSTEAEDTSEEEEDRVLINTTTAKRALDAAACAVLLAWARQRSRREDPPQKKKGKIYVLAPGKAWRVAVVAKMECADLVQSYRAGEAA